MIGNPQQSVFTDRRQAALRRGLAGLERWHAPKGWRGLALVLSVSALLAGVWLLVYLTGGTQLSYAHLVYIPILVASFFYMVPGGVLAAIAGGLLLGPAMPLDVEAGIAQSPLNWSSRMAFLVLIGAFAGLLFAVMREQLRAVRLAGHFDPRTGLPNRSAFVEDVDRALSEEMSDPLMVLSIELEGYDTVVLNLGQQYGDRLIEQAIDRLKEVVPSRGRLYQLRSTRFAVVVTPARPCPGEDLARTAAAAFEEPLTVGEVPLHLNPRVGTAIAPDHGKTAWSLLRRSLSALHFAVTTDNLYSHYQPQWDAEQRRHYSLVGDAREALADGTQFELHFQPKLALASGRCVGAEALVRWRHPVHGTIPPGDFIPLLESTELIKPLTRWVADAGVAALRRFPTEGEALSLAINVTMRDLEDAAIVESLAACVQHHGADHGRIVLEVTESALAENLDRVGVTLANLRKLGFSIAVDDFGTGQSALAYLKELPVDCLKIDRSFVKNLTDDQRACAIVRRTLQLAHDLGLVAVAEGIENRQSYELLRAWNCDQAQGYYIAKPMPEADFLAWLTAPPRQATG